MFEAISKGIVFVYHRAPLVISLPLKKFMVSRNAGPIKTLYNMTCRKCTIIVNYLSVYCDLSNL